MSKLIIQILTKIFTQNVEIQDEIVKKNVEICRENEKQDFIARKNMLSDDARKADNEMKKTKQGQWANGGDYWNDVEEEIFLNQNNGVDIHHDVKLDEIDPREYNGEKEEVEN